MAIIRTDHYSGIAPEDLADKINSYLAEKPSGVMSTQHYIHDFCEELGIPAPEGEESLMSFLGTVIIASKILESRSSIWLPIIIGEYRPSLFAGGPFLSIWPEGETKKEIVISSFEQGIIRLESTYPPGNPICVWPSVFLEMGNIPYPCEQFEKMLFGEIMKIISDVLIVRRVIDRPIERTEGPYGVVEIWPSEEWRKRRGIKWKVSSKSPGG